MSRLEPGSVSVLVVEDSAAVAEFLQAVLGADPAIRVVGVARDGQAAIEAAHRLRPAIITMDVHMPGMGGFEATRRIMETCPTPVVIVSGMEPHDAGAQPLAQASGALAMVPLPHGFGHPGHADTARTLTETVKLMSEVKVVRRWPQPGLAKPAARPGGGHRCAASPRLIAIGASTGGPLVLQTLLRGLPRHLPMPVLIVQHMAAGFVSSFCEWLQQSTGFPVRIAADGEPALAGQAYLAPDGLHMGLGGDDRIVLAEAPAENGVRPAVSFLFRSIVPMASRVVAVLLTGMGRDGVEELLRLKDEGALTLVQDEASCVVFGMPGQAVKAGAASHVLSPEAIAGKLASLAPLP